MGRPLDHSEGRGSGGHYLLPFNSALIRIAKKLEPEPAPRRAARKQRQKIPGLSVRHSTANPRTSRFSDHDVICAVVLRELGCRREVIAKAIGCHVTTLEQWIAGTNRRLVTL